MMVAALMPAAAQASTIGVANIAAATVDGSHVLSAPPPYSVIASGATAGGAAFEASESGFLTDVSIKHFNDADVTVKILIFRADSATTMHVAAVAMTMVLPVSDSPGVVTTQAAPNTPVSPGDRIGLVVLSGGPLVKLLNNSLSAVSAPGVYPSPSPTSEPVVDDGYTVADLTLGPLIRGTVSSSTGGGGGGGAGTPTPPSSSNPKPKPKKGCKKPKKRSAHFAKKCKKKKGKK
jgi:hypothetical protein